MSSSHDDAARGQNQYAADDAAEGQSARLASLPGAADHDQLGTVFRRNIEDLLPRPAAPHERLDNHSTSEHAGGRDLALEFDE